MSTMKKTIGDCATRSVLQKGFARLIEKKEPLISDRRKGRKSGTRTGSCIQIFRCACLGISVAFARFYWEDKRMQERRGVEEKLSASDGLKLDSEYAFQDAESLKTCL